MEIKISNENEKKTDLAMKEKVLDNQIQGFEQNTLQEIPKFQKPSELTFKPFYQYSLLFQIYQNSVQILPTIKQQFSYSSQKLYYLQLVMIPHKYLEIKAFNHNKESHGLFDYENQNVNFEKLVIYKSGCIIKNGEKYEVVFPKQLALKTKESEFAFLANVAYNEQEEEFELAFEPPEPDVSQNNDEKFIIIRTLQQPQMQVQHQSYNLQPGDLFRLGKIEFQVVEKRSTDLIIKLPTQYYSKHITLTDNLDEDQTFHCKFCLSESKLPFEDHNPMIYNICKCVGNLSYVHLKCLTLWIDQHIEKLETLFGAYLQWTRAFECQVCQEILPMRVTVNKQIYDLFQFERPNIPYLIIEQINREKGTCNELYLIHGWNTDPIKIGRGQGCDIRLNEITVSRQHASINVKDDEYWLRDNNSKFGALVLLKNIRQVEECLNIKQIDQNKLQMNFQQCGFQVGKTVLIFNFRHLKSMQKESYQQSLDVQDKQKNRFLEPREYQSNQYLLIQDSPRLQQKLTKIPQISDQIDEDEPQMDDDSESEVQKKNLSQNNVL